jgi:hypothetical protein
MPAIHPAPTQFSPEQIAADPILHFFHYAHLPAALQPSSKPFCDVAEFLIGTLPRNAERSVALRKLLEAKDAAVRANVGAAVTSGALASKEPGTFQTRLLAERADLKQKTDALSRFLNGEQAGASPQQVAMLYDQLTAMENYLGILTARIENLDLPEGVGMKIDPEEGRSDPYIIGDFREDPPEFFKD